MPCGRVWSMRRPSSKLFSSALRQVQPLVRWSRTSKPWISCIYRHLHTVVFVYKSIHRDRAFRVNRRSDVAYCGCKNVAAEGGAVPRGVL